MRLSYRESSFREVRRASVDILLMELLRQRERCQVGQICKRGYIADGIAIQIERCQVEQTTEITGFQGCDASIG